MKIRNGKRIYGAWAGDPNGREEDESRCVEEVWSSDGFGFPHQCFRKRGFGNNGLWCKQHAKKEEERNARDTRPQA